MALMIMSTLTKSLKQTMAAVMLAALPAAAWAQQTVPPAGASGQALPLSMDQAVQMALEANLGLKAERLDVDVAAHSIAIARSAFLPQVSSTIRNRNAKSLPTDFTQGSSDISSNGVTVSGSVSQVMPWYGGSYSATWQGSRTTQSGGFSAFNPNLGSFLQLGYTQPLLSGFRTDAFRVNLQNAERRRAIADIQLEQRIVLTETAVRQRYLGLVAAIEGLKVAEQNFKIAQDSLTQSRARVGVGQSPQIEIIQAEAQVASNQVGVIAAQAEISTAEDLLRELIMDPARPDYWTVRLSPTDQIQLTPREIDVEAAVKNALATRLDLVALKRDLEITDLNLKLSQDLARPSVDLNLQYSAQGTAGTLLEFGSGFPPPIVSRSTRSFGGALSDTFLNAYPTWSVGVTVAYPFGRTAAEASYAQAQVQKRQQEINIRARELQIQREVRDAARLVQNSFQRVQAARAAREASETQLSAEERRNTVGLSTTLDLQIRQRDLAQARIIELNAMIQYNQALINFDRVQKTN
jgi:outer membrane protein